MRCSIDDIEKSENTKMLYILYFQTNNVLLNPGNEYKIYNEIYSQYLPESIIYFVLYIWLINKCTDVTFFQ